MFVIEKQVFGLIDWKLIVIYDYIWEYFAIIITKERETKLEHFILEGE